MIAISNKRLQERSKILTAALAHLAAVLSVQAQSYETSVIASGLERPMGIAVDGRGDLFFTQIPTPGVPGSMGGTNQVSTRDAQTGAITTISMGEPEPTHVDVTRQGVIYWTCKSAGVILQHDQGTTSLVVDGLDEPSGIAVQDRGPNHGAIYFTEVPTPGVPGSMGGANGVFVLADDSITKLSMGEPEPVDVAIDRDGSVYWTCKSAGVILTRQAATGQISLLLGSLDSPVGIALDEVGNLYFTEVPTPGVPGSAGGSNQVWKYALDSSALTLIDEGDPEPTDIAVSASGRDVFWTCTSAGVIVHAQLIN